MARFQQSHPKSLCIFKVLFYWVHILFWNSEEYISEWNYPHILCCSITPAGYSWLIPVISDIHAQIAWLSRNNYKLCLWIHSQTIFTNMAMRVLVYFWVEIAFISLSFAHNSQIANMILAKCQRSATFVERCFQFHKEFYTFKCHNWWKCAFSFLKIRNLI